AVVRDEDPQRVVLDRKVEPRSSAGRASLKQDYKCEVFQGQTRRGRKGPKDHIKSELFGEDARSTEVFLSAQEALRRGQAFESLARQPSWVRQKTAEYYARSMSPKEIHEWHGGNPHHYCDRG
ncbi:unnamed protein product, partial [Amoebophrya sp. A25]